MPHDKLPPKQALLPESAQIYDTIKRVFSVAYRKDFKRITSVKLLDAVTFNASVTSKTGLIFNVPAFSNALILIDIVVTGSPTDILISIEFSHDRVNWYKFMRGPFGDLRFAGQASHKFQIDKLMRTCYFVPESKPLRNLFAEFRQKKVHVAVVLDEYGGTAGLITNEDIIEQIVGQITDEYEPSETAAVRQIDEQTIEIDARMRIDELNEQLSLDLPESEDYETLGGFLFSSMGRIPSAGETYSYHNKLLTIMEAAPRRISRVKLEILPVVDQQQGDSGLEESP